MKIRTKKDRVFHLANDEVLAALLDAEIVSPVVDAPPPRKVFAPDVRWSVIQTVPGGHIAIRARCESCGIDETLFSPGGPDWRLAHCGGLGHDAVPPDIREKVLMAVQA